jgi:Cu/Ag efflux protein CusF
MTTHPSLPFVTLSTKTARTAATLLLCAGVATMLPLSAARAQTVTPAGSDAATAAPQTWVAGEVRRVDAALNRLTVRHGDIPHLDMGAMTMVFRLKPGLLTADQLKAMKAGDRIEFQAEAPQGQLTITALRRPMVQPMGQPATPPASPPSDGKASDAHTHAH